MEFIKFLVKWIASNLSIPFWMVGHVHLTMNVYEDVMEIWSSIGSIVMAFAGLTSAYVVSKGSGAGFNFDSLFIMSAL